MLGSDRDGVIVTISRLEMALFVQEMQAKMDTRQAQYGDSWRTLSVEDHIKGLDSEIDEWHENRRRKSRELVDIANCAMMLWNAIQKER